ncbi:hypothetical protein OHB06_01275 [Streptomyces sp. NBC_01604]|uniref:hypothetical protein n=1 Tax=Streptomyces sp. NBC_01604 TaxID=2975894 RepID=UPI0038658FFA
MKTPRILAKRSRTHFERVSTGVGGPKMRRCAAVIVTALAAIGLTAAPASAAPVSIYAISSDPSAYAYATFQWSDGGGVHNIDLRVYDWECDNHPTYAYFQTYRSGSGTYGTTAHRYDYSGCDTSDWASWSDLYIPDSGDRIVGLRLRVCVNDAGNDTCAWGPWTNR